MLRIVFYIKLNILSFTIFTLATIMSDEYVYFKFIPYFHYLTH